MAYSIDAVPFIYGFPCNKHICLQCDIVFQVKQVLFESWFRTPPKNSNQEKVSAKNFISSRDGSV